jgi:membrane fusion protein (multidrug efflux system)
MPDKQHGNGMRWLIGIALVLAVAGAAAWYFVSSPGPGTPAAAKSTGGSSVITVEAGPVKLSAVRRQIDAVGSLRSTESVIIRPEISGRITEILFDEGQQVRRGMPLFRLDAAIARAQLEQAKASLVLSKANHERAEDLYRRGAGTQRARDEAVSKLRADEASVALAQATLDKATLMAPFDGIIGLRKVSVGDYVNPGQDLVNLENIEQLKVDFRVPEIYSMQIKVGQSVQIRLDAIPNSAYDGTVYAIDPAYDPNGRAIILRARLANRDGLLRSGMFARVTLLVDEREQAIVVPETALVPIGGEQFIYRVVDGKAVLTKVVIGQRRRGQVEIVDGLERDAVIVTEGAVKLRDGSAVRTVAPRQA